MKPLNRACTINDTGPTTLPHNSSAGFTLIEILVAIAILGILSTIVAHHVIQHVDESKQIATKAKVDTVHSVVADYKIRHGKLPPSLEALTEPDKRKNGRAWLKRSELRDAWKHPLVLEVGQKAEFEIVSYGEGHSKDGFEWDYGLEMDIGSRHPLGNEYDE